MVRCIECRYCSKIISDVNGRKFFICGYRYLEILDLDAPEKWILTMGNPQILEKMLEVKPFEDHKCDKFVPKNVNVEPEVGFSGFPLLERVGGFSEWMRRRLKG